MTEGKITRRALIHGASITGAVAVTASALAQNAGAKISRIVKNGQINQSASRWCYCSLSLEQLCEAGAKLGLKGIDLLKPDDFPTLKKHGLVCTMTSGGGAVNDKTKHEQAISRIRAAIEATAEYGFPNVIAMSGNRGEIPDDGGGDVSARRKDRADTRPAGARCCGVRDLPAINPGNIYLT